MTHQEGIGSAFADLNALLIDVGPAAITEVFAALMNRDNKIEREQALKAESHQRSPDLQGYVNGFKAKALKTRVVEVNLRIPQTRGFRDDQGRPFYPRAFERGVRSERAIAMAEMYVRGSARGKSPRSSRSSVASKSPRRRSAALPPNSMSSSTTGETVPSAKSPTSSLTPGTRRCELMARSCPVPSLPRSVSAPTASRRSSDVASPSARYARLGQDLQNE
jgi:hypothetical protein